MEIHVLPKGLNTPKYLRASKNEGFAWITFKMDPKREPIFQKITQDCGSEKLSKKHEKSGPNLIN